MLTTRPSKLLTSEGSMWGRGTRAAILGAERLVPNLHARDSVQREATLPCSGTTQLKPYFLPAAVRRVIGAGEPLAFRPPPHQAR
jgi:hypothetical protein